MEEALKELKEVPPIKLIAVKFWYVLGLFTIIYLLVLIYALTVGLNPASEYSALIVAGLAAVITAVDLVLLLSNRLSPAIIAMVLWIAPFYALYKLFRHTELLNLDSTYFTQRIKQCLSTPALIRTAG